MFRTMKERVWFGYGTEGNLHFRFRHAQVCMAGKSLAHCTIAEFAVITFTLTFMHLADALIQSDLQCIQIIHFLSVCVFPRI